MKHWHFLCIHVGEGRVYYAYDILFSLRSELHFSLCSFTSVFTFWCFFRCFSLIYSPSCIPTSEICCGYPRMTCFLAEWVCSMPTRIIIDRYTSLLNAPVHIKQHFNKTCRYVRRPGNSFLHDFIQVAPNSWEYLEAACFLTFAPQDQRK